MSIKVICGCGFCSLLPSEWEGKRVKCKCGRTFVVSRTDAEVPPPAETPAAEPVPPTVAPSPWLEPAGALPEPPLPLPAEMPAEIPACAAIESPVNRAETLHRKFRSSRLRNQVLLAFVMIMLALASLGAVLVVLRDYDWSITAMLNPTNQPSDSDSPDVAGKDTPSGPQSRSRTDSVSVAAKEGTEDAVPATEGNTATRLANLAELAAEDGLLLSGMFGEGVEQLALTAAQQETVAEVLPRLQQQEQELKEKKLTLEQWYAATRKAGDELLAVLTDAQRQQLQMLIERQEVQRLHLVDYSARILPELSVAQMPWSVPTAGRSFRLLEKSSFAAAAQDLVCRASEPTGLLATLATASAADAPRKLVVWDLIKDRQDGSVDITSPVAESVNLLSRDGRHWVLVHKQTDAPATVEVWSIEAGKMVDSKELPGTDGQYTVRDCVAHRVVALGVQGYWVWDFESGKAQEVGFPEARPDASPCLAVSADGSNLVVAHPHITAAPNESCFVEVCIYRVDTGALLGNQVFHKDYLRSSIGAMALSHDGRELALLWDFGPENPTRRLVHLHAGNGKILKTVEGLPPADQGYARQHQLADRELIWLPENSGWVVNLQNVVDAETGAVLPLELPVKADAPAGDNAAGSEIVEAVPAGDGRLLLIIADRPASPDEKGKMRSQFVDLPRLGPFQ